MNIILWLIGLWLIWRLFNKIYIMYQYSDYNIKNEINNELYNQFKNKYKMYCDKCEKNSLQYMRWKDNSLNNDVKKLHNPVVLVCLTCNHAMLDYNEKVNYDDEIDEDYSINNKSYVKISEKMKKNLISI